MNERDIFDAALAITDLTEQTAYLDQVCGANAELRSRIQELLDAQQRLGNFLDSPPSGIEATYISPVSEQPGDTIGPFKLLQQIGEGGMGTVFMAEQSEPVERRVALKIIKPGMDTQQVIARFEAERQALAMMDHPNIAKVLDAGTTDSGRPYFVMELVKGMSVTQYCDEQHLTPRERLELFVPICQAVQHAHQKGIIHRDLKPSNILIARYDDKPVPKIIDFGVAKATSQRLTEKTMFTQYGQIVGTMEYMSPEQANFNQLDVDTRSDVYSLGVLLYELLTGETPFDKKRLRSAAFDELLRIIREEDPPRPSTRLSNSESLANTAVNRKTEPKKLSVLVRGELDWIVMKALEKDRTQRYETASKFAEDVSHYLNNEAVLACPPSAAYKFRKFARRNKAFISTTAAIGLSLIAGIIGTTWQAIEADKERDRAIIAESDAIAEADRAAKAENLAERRLDVVESQKDEIETEKQKVEVEKEKAEQEKQIAEAVKDFLQNKLLGQADVMAQADALLQAGGLASEAKPNPTIRELLDRSAVELSEEKIEQNFPGQPRLQIEILTTVGIAYRGVSAYERSIEFLSRSREMCKKEFGPDHPRTLTTMHNLALVYQDAGRLDEALPLHEETLKLKTERLGFDHPDTLTTMNNLAGAYQTAGRLDKALTLCEETLKLQKETLGPDHPSTLTTICNLALIYSLAGRMDEALPLYEETLKLLKKTLGPDHPRTLKAMNNLAAVYFKTGRFDEALPLLEETLKLNTERLGFDHPDTLTTMNNLAVAYQTAGRSDKALTLCEETLKLQKETLGPDHHGTLNTMSNLASAYQAAGRLDEALPLYEETLKLRKETLGPDHPDTLTTMHNLASAYQAAGRLDEALPLYEETLKLQTEKLGTGHPDTLTMINNLAVAYQAASRLDEALPLYEETLKLQKETLGPDHPDTLTTMHNLAVAYDHTGRLDEALTLCEELLKLRREKLGTDHPDTLISMHNLALIYDHAGRLDEALTLCEELLKLRKEKLGTDHHDTLTSMHNLALIYKHAGRLDEALTLCEELLKLRKEKLGTDHHDTLTSMHNLALIYKHAGRLDEALTLCEEMLKLRNEKLGLDHDDTLESVDHLFSLAFLIRQEGRFSDALPLFEQVYQLKQKSESTPPKFKIDAENHYGRALFQVQQFAEAEPRLLDSYRNGLASENFPPAWLVKYRMCLSDLYTAWGRPVEAQRWREEGVKLAKIEYVRSKDQLGLDHPETLKKLNHLTIAYRYADKLDLAIPLWETQSSLQPEKTLLTLKVTSLQVWFGREEELATTVDRALNFASDTEDPTIAERTAKACCLQPSNDQARLAAVLKLARLAVELGQSSDFIDHYRMTLGMAEYRNGNFDAANEALLAVVKKRKDHRYLGCTSSFYHAMSLFRQGKQNEAREQALSALEYMKPLPTDEKNPLANKASADDLIAWLAFKEAKALIGFEESASAE